MHHKLYGQNGYDTMYPRHMVCFRHVSVHTLHKGDNVVIIIGIIGAMFSVFFVTFSSYNLIRIRIAI
jgi:hypothetical protein